MKIAILSSYTLDLVPKETAKWLKQHYAIETDWYVTPFGQYRQEILNPLSGSKQFQPNVVFLALTASEFGSPKEATELITSASQAYPGATLLIQNCSAVQSEPMRMLEWNRASSAAYRAAQINCKLSETSQDLPNAYILDTATLVSRYGLGKMFDARYYYLAKMHFSAFGMKKIAEWLGVALAALAGKRKKCLVLDLDNTLWGGIIGEDGIEHIKLSNDGEGKAFYDFQKGILKLYQTGTILAICSKNDQETAIHAIENHPSMLLRKEHFAALRINWLDKASNMKSIAEDLNIATDSFVYLDDSAHERELLRFVLPEVVVPEMPNDFSLYPSFLADLPYFETFSVTTEDAERGKMYALERQRTDARENAKSLEDFLKSLEIKISVSEANSFSIPRIAQLTQKTNQFNLTTRRYTESQIKSMTENQKWKVLCVSATDKVGDSGLVGVAILELAGHEVRLDTFLLSCRVLGRGIEQAFLSAIRKIASKTGAHMLFAEYIPTDKNKAAKNFLSEQGFTMHNGKFFRALEGYVLQYPQWIEVHYG